MSYMKNTKIELDWMSHIPHVFCANENCGLFSRYKEFIKSSQPK